MRFRDDRVVPVTEKEVLAIAHGGRGQGASTRDGEASMLVYVKVGKQRTTAKPVAPKHVRESALRP